MSEQDHKHKIAYAKKIAADTERDFGVKVSFDIAWRVCFPDLPVPNLNEGDGELMSAPVRTKPEDVIHTAEVIRHGEKIIVPLTMEYPQAIGVLERLIKDENELISISEPIDCYPWEGAIAMKKALERMFGFGGTIATPSWFGPVPPKELAIETGPDTKVMAPWGRFGFALATSDSEWLGTGTAMKDGRTIFAMSGVVKKKWKATIAQLGDLVRKIVREESIYNGKALRIEFTDADGDDIEIPTPKFVDLRKANVGEMVYTKELESLIETNILTPLKHTKAVKAAGIPLKRGILLAGPYGTGKSLLARGIAKVGTENGWTFIYIKDAGELPRAIKFAAMYQPAVIFAEDVDRHMAGGRTEAMDEILNTLDGIDSKHMELMVVLTTNHLDQINSAMLRPGRLDVILNITTPDSEAVMRLIHVYGRGTIDQKTDLTKAGELLQGYTPAVIREVVERAKLVSIARTGQPGSTLIGADIETSALTMVQQQALLKKPDPVKESWHSGMVEEIADKVHTTMNGNGLGEMRREVNSTLQTTQRIARSVGA